MTVDFTKIKVDQIRTMLIEAGADEEKVNGIKGKANLVEAYNSFVPSEEPITTEENLDNELDELFSDLDMDEVGELGAILEEEEGYVPSPTNSVVVDPKLERMVETNEDYGTVVQQEIHNTQDSIMEMFLDDEMIDGYPKAVGLRRVAEIVIGKIISSGPTNVIVSQDPNGLPMATVTYNVRFQNGLDFSEVADAWRMNTPDMFAVHPSATASTRAEGRALRKALGLNIVTAEEMDNDKDPSELLSLTTEGAINVMEELDRTEITAAQVSMIKSKCVTFGIDVEKFINKKFYTGKADTKTFNNIEEVPYEVAKSMIKELNRYQGDHDDSREIPEEIKS